MQNVNKQSLWMLHIAVMLFGLSGVIGKYITCSAAAITWGRTLCSSAVLLLLLLLRRQTLKVQCRRDGALLFLAGLVLAAHWTSFFQAVKVASVAIGTITFSTFPLFLTILEPICFREAFQRKNLFLSLLLLLGILLTVPEFSAENQITLGILWGLGSSATYAVLSLLNRYLSNRYDGMIVCFYEQLTVMVALWPMLVISQTVWKTMDIWWVAVLGVLCTAFAFSLFVYGQRYQSAQKAGIISGLETVYGVLFAMVLLQELPTWRELLGGAVIVSAVLLSAAAPWKNAKKKNGLSE